MIKYKGYRAVPINQLKCDDIAFSTGQTWAFLRLLLVELSYIEERMGVDNVRVKNCNCLLTRLTVRINCIFQILI